MRRVVSKESTLAHGISFWTRSEPEKPASDWLRQKLTKIRACILLVAQVDKSSPGSYYVYYYVYNYFNISAQSFFKRSTRECISDVFWSPNNASIAGCSG